MSRYAEQLRADLLEALSLRAHESGVTWLSIWLHARAEDSSVRVWPTGVLQLRKAAAWLDRQQVKYRAGSVQQRELASLTQHVRESYERLIESAQGGMS